MLGVNISAAGSLTAQLRRWAQLTDQVADDLAIAERIAGLPSGAVALLDDIGMVGRAMAASIDHASQNLTSFTVDRYLGGLSSIQLEPPKTTDVANPADLALFKTGSGLHLSNGELNAIAERVAELTIDERDRLIQSLSESQLARLFHNVHSTGWLSNDWDDAERAAFYADLIGLSAMSYERISAYTQYFEPWEPGVHPAQVPIAGDAFVARYRLIARLDLDEFLALRSYVWRNEEVRASSPFDWSADGCSIPFGGYPQELEGPCVLHDFAYRNARLAADRYGGGYNDTTAASGHAWKHAADLRLHDDIAVIDGGSSRFRRWATIVYAGVTTDVGWGPSGRAAFEQPYEARYGPGFEPFLGEARPGSPLAQRVIGLAAVASVSSDESDD